MKKQRYHFSDKGSYSQSFGFSSSHIQRCELDYKVSWIPKNWWRQTVVLEKTLESPLESRRPVSIKGNNPWILIGRTDAKVEALATWCKEPTHWGKKKKNWFWKDLEQEEKGATEDEMVGWPHWLNGHEFEQTQGDSEGQGSLTCYSLWGHKESDTAERLNNNRKIRLDGPRAMQTILNLWFVYLSLVWPQDIRAQRF